MPTELTLSDAEAKLRADGRFAWLLGGRQAWSVQEIAEKYAEATGVEVSHDTVTRWVRQLGNLYGESAAENYGRRIGWRVSRDALIRFFAERHHLYGSAAAHADDGE